MDTSVDGARTLLGLWSDGVTMWLLSNADPRIYAYAVPGLDGSGNSLEPPSDAFRVQVRTRVRKAGPPGAASADVPVALSDPALGALVGAALGKVPDAPVGAREMASLVGLNAREAGITDLAGLEYAVNLEELDLGGNPVADPQVLGALPRLRVLNLDGVRSDLWSLAGRAACASCQPHPGRDGTRRTDGAEAPGPEGQPGVGRMAADRAAGAGSPGPARHGGARRVGPGRAAELAATAPG